MNRKSSWWRRAVGRLFESIARKLDVPTNKQTWQLAIHWDYIHTNQDELWDIEVDPDALRDALELRANDPTAAFASLLNLAAAGSAIAMNEVAECYCWGRLGVLNDMGRAEAWSKRAFEAGSQRGMLNYGKLLAWRGEFSDAEAAFSRGANSGWAPALFWLAKTKLDQPRTPTRLVDARRLLEQAADLGHPEAKGRLGRDMALGVYGLRLIPRGFHLLAEFADQTLREWSNRDRSASRTTSSGETIH